MAKIKVIIAGPGAGKTYNLKNEVLSCLPYLDKNRFCAVITYTNSATDELKRRLSSDIPIPPNVFIGTIHSFLIRFVIEPFGHLLGIVPIEKSYIDNIKSDIPQRKNAIQKNLSDKGMVTFDKVLQLSKETIKVRGIKETFVNRLQFLFVDEYQDSKNNSHEFFMKIIKDIERSYIIGDKLQTIYDFVNRTNTNKNLSDTSFANLIKKFPKNREKTTINFRSSEAIVQLINFYIEPEFKQSAKNGNNGIPVYFISKSSPSDILESYKHKSSQHNIDQIHTSNIESSDKLFFRDLFLTSEWIDSKKSRKAKWKGVLDALENEANKLDKGNLRTTGVLEEVSRCILGVTGAKKQDFIKSPIDELDYRKFCFETVRYLKNMNLDGYQNRVGFIRAQFLKRFKTVDKTGLFVDVEKSVDELSRKVPIIYSYASASCYSSIHGAKGLEATSVLVIAYSNHELDKWLDFQKANEDLDDDYRLGYVAFSRARDMLCIACLENVSNETKEKMNSLGIVTY